MLWLDFMRPLDRVANLGFTSGVPMSTDLLSTRHLELET